MKAAAPCKWIAAGLAGGRKVDAGSLSRTGAIRPHSRERVAVSPVYKTKLSNYFELPRTGEQIHHA